MSQRALAITKQWIEQWVIGLNLCPFAKYPYERGRVRISLSVSRDENEIFKDVLQQLDELYHNDPQTVETTVVVVENGLRDFDDYLQMLDTLESVLPQTGLEGIIQIASFHPDYCFADSDDQDVSNYTNRSPYPLFHLIREASLEKALEPIENPGQIPRDNIQLMREMGLNSVKRILDNLHKAEDIS